MGHCTREIKLQVAAKARQADRSIHFVVLRKQFYTAHLQPLLAEWMLIRLGGKGVSRLTDHQVLEFLKDGSSSRCRHLRRRQLHDAEQ